MILLSELRQIYYMIKAARFDENGNEVDPHDPIIYRCWKLFNALLTGGILPPDHGPYPFRTITADPATQHYRWPRP